MTSGDRAAPAPPAVVLVGGEGTRLRPLTYRTPKQLLPVAGVPLLRRVVQPLEAAGVERVVLSTGYRAGAFDGIDLGPFDVTAVVEESPLGSGGGLAHAIRTAGIDGTFVALNGDVLGDVDIPAILDLHRTSGAAATILLTQVDDPSEFGVAVVHESGRVERFVEKPAPPAPSDLINAGVWVLESTIFDPVAAGATCSIEREIFPGLAEGGSMTAVEHRGWWHDVGRLDRYLAATRDCVRSGSVPRGWRREGDSVSAPDASVDHSATIEASVLGAGTRVLTGAVVRDSVLLDGATVGRDARVERSIVGPGWSVGEAEEVIDAIQADPSPSQR
ncbi:MAG TPA: NDP-sugar synthase [Acidimicrobiales bacterium]|nr:NDP-sugar synthase [Acidimicrobiales bacterium]